MRAPAVPARRGQLGHEDEEDAYEPARPPHGVTPRQAARVFAIGSWREAIAGEELCCTGIPTSAVTLLVRGEARVQLHSREAGVPEGGSFATSADAPMKMCRSIVRMASDSALVLDTPAEEPHRLLGRYAGLRQT